MKKKIIYSFIYVLLVFGFYYGYKIYKKYSVVEVEIEKVKVTKGDMDITFEDIGDIEPKNSVEVHSLVSGQITDIFVQEGDVVKKGQKLAIVQPGQSSADKFMPVEVLSPIDGVVLKCKGSGYYDEPHIVKIGERVSGSNEYNPTCIMKVADFSKMIVKLEVNEGEVVKLKKGMKVKIYIDVMPGKEFNGKISVISPNAQKERMGGAKSFPVEVEINEKLDVLPGMTARVFAVLETKKNILKMPLSALFEEKGRYFVYLYDAKNNKAKKVFVTCGIRNEMEVQILSGLKEGDEVYTDKPLNIEEDDKVSKNS